MILFGLLPAWEAARENLHAAARRSIAPRRQRRLREALVIGELALAVALAFGAGILLRSYARLTSLPLGFNPHHLLTFTTRIPPGPARETTAQQHAREAALVQAALPKLEALPGVRAAAASTVAPFEGLYVGTVKSGRGPHRVAIENHLSPGYWQALGIRLLAGRDFTASDGPNSRRVVVVSQALAQELWPGRSPLGRQLFADGASKTPSTVVGEVANSMQFGPVGDMAFGVNMLAQPAAYFPLRQGAGQPEISFSVRTGVPAARLAPSVRRLFRRLNPTQPVFAVQTVEQRLASLLAGHRLYLELLLALAALAIVLVVAGIYGVTRFMAAARTGEMGIRKALGAEDAAVLRLLLSRVVLLAAIGTAAGCGLALLLARLLTSLLYGVQPTDPATLGAIAALAFAVAVAAAFGPARHAAEIEPMDALRRE